MKKINFTQRIVLFAFCALSVNSANAWNDVTRSPHNPQTVARAAGCAPATAITFLELNNVRALIENGGSMWQNRNSNVGGSYFVPKTPDGSPGPSAIFSGSLWMGGVDVNNQLKIAALKFRQGNDFWPGPLTTTGDAEIDANVCLAWDKFFMIRRAEVELFAAWYKCTNDPNCDETALPAQTQDALNRIRNWPAHGDVTLNQDFYLAPFYDNNGDGIYNPDDGDYPWYDIENDQECNANDRIVALFGDQTYWWIFNDKGNVHTESGGDPIGMEIRAQAFAFTTNDEVNNMTFYNYELINRSTQTLVNTYFGKFADTDLGCSEDDFVGCDVRRGLGYCFNGNSVDALGCNGAIPYGANPPAVGIDFFEGPYKDNDGIDNPGPSVLNGNFITYNQAIAGDGIVYKGMGIGYGDGKIDNERFGMRRFVYFSRVSPNPNMTDPTLATHYYNYMRGLWKDGTQMCYGGTGYSTGGGCVPALYMFPGTSDPQGWGTGGVPQSSWSEFTENNAVGDRRFVQSAGPFTLEPGARNNITVGVVWARANGGGLYAPVELLKLADDKAQALFDNCFEILEGPDAPDLTIQELDNELILYISNNLGNNVNEEYVKEDPFIITPDSLVAIGQIWDNKYRFQGYQIFQLKAANVGAQELYDVDKARLVAQVDLKDGVAQLINWTLDENIGVISPQEMVDGADKGVKHSFKITEDQFAVGSRRLVNHKKYYFMAIAYGHNEYKPFDPTDATRLDGQKKPYISSRKSGAGTEIQVYTGVPHHPAPESQGTIQNSEYGDGVRITRVEGMGNGGLLLEITPETEARIVANYKDALPEYQRNGGPLNIKVVDPLNVEAGIYELRFIRGTSTAMIGNNLEGRTNINQASWILTNTVTGESVSSERSIKVGNEQVIPQWGISVMLEQHLYTTVGGKEFTDFLTASIEFKDSSRRWLSGVEDGEGFSISNWIRSGTLTETANADECPNPIDWNDYGTDPDEEYENIIGGTWAPFSLCGVQRPCIENMPIATAYNPQRAAQSLSELMSVDIVFTSDKSKWTRCPVIEMGDYAVQNQGQAAKMEIRKAASVDVNGNPDGSGEGMGWFPGYAIDLETGERLNMAFGEDSWLAVDNGRDMIWNPTSRLTTGLGSAIFGGKHYIYVFKNEARKLGPNRMPSYDGGTFIEASLKGSSSAKNFVWRSCMWVGMPMLSETGTLLESDVKIKIRVSKPYERYATGAFSLLNTGQDTISSQNSWLPLYRFTTEDLATVKTDAPTAEDALAMINVVPNPYYAFSAYETGRLDNRIKVTNLPEECVVTIYTVNGTLVRQLTKDDPTTSIDWDLKNFRGIPVASGTYLIHVNVPGVGERILKWFGAIRPPDLDNF